MTTEPEPTTTAHHPEGDDAATAPPPGVVSVESLPYLRGPVPGRRRPNGSTVAWVAGLAALVAVLVTGAWAITQRDAAEDARGQAQIWQAEVDRLTGDRTSTADDLDAARRRATALEAEVTGLRTQLAQVTGQLDEASTANAAAVGERDTLARLARQGPTVAAEVQRCADARAVLLDRALRAAVDPAAQPAFDAAAATADQACVQAQQALTALERSVAELDAAPAP